MDRIIKRKLFIEPKFHQTDMMGVIHNAEYFHWFEDGRLAIMREILPLSEVVRRNIAVFVVSNSCDYLHPVRLGDELVLTTTHEIHDPYAGKLVFDHSLVHAKKKTEMAQGRSVMTIMDMAAGTLVKTWPEDVWERYKNLK
jgi:acyl-CoA thioester hydrolase